MTVCATAWAMSRNTGSPLAKLVLLFMADQTDMDGRCRALPESLAPYAECSPDEVREAIAVLRRGGFIRVVADDEYFLHAPIARPIGSSLVRKLAERDGLKCRYCGDEVGPFEADHVIPRSRGGPDALHNRVIACRDCNQSKGARTPEEWRAAG